MNLDELTQSISDMLTEELPPRKQLFDQLVNFFVSDNWSFTRLHSESVLYTAIRGKHDEWNCYAQIREEQEQFVFYSICPVDVPEERRLAIAEFLTRANFGTILGNFEMDFENGEIHYKTSIDVTDDFLSYALIKQLVYANVGMMDTYLPGIQAVMAGDASPADAIRKLESPDEVAQVSTEQIEEPDNTPVEV